MKVVNNAKNALSECLQRNNVQRKIYQPDFVKGKAPLFQFDVDDCEENVCIVIFMKNEYEITRQCVNSILQKTTYSNYKILLIDNEIQRAGID